MTDTARTPMRRAIVTGLATAGALACFAAVHLDTAMAEEPAKLASPADIEEMAGALGYEGSHSPGFWEALAQAVADQRAAEKERADAEHAEQLKQAMLDAGTYGRRIEETVGEGDLKGTKVTEFLPSASGDIVDGEVYVRTSWETVAPDGTKKTSTVYWAPNSGRQLGIVETEVKDGVETVTKVVEYEPGSIDVKEGDERPVPPEGSSAAGKKPHTWDPKADGSLGKASGGQPDGGAKIEKTDTPPVQETTAGGERVEFDPIKLPDDKVITPFVETKPLNAPEDLPHRSGYDLEHPDWDGAVARITAYFDTEGKLAGVVGSVIQNGKETIVAVEEVTPGSLGLKKGDERTTPDNILKSNQPSTWDPKPRSGTGSGTTTGGTQPTGGSTSPSESEPEQDPEPVDGERDSASPSYEPPATAQEPTVKWASESYTSPEGDKYTAYTVTNDDGSHTTGVQTERTDGTKSCKVQTADGEQDAECPGGLTDEPTCQVDCARLAMLTELFFCASGGATPAAECGQAPEGLRPSPSAAPDCDDGQATNRITTESDASGAPTVQVSGGQVDGYAKPDCSSAEQPGGPIDYGDPTDPNGADPVDPSQVDDNDGVTDPVNPGEPEEMVAGSIRLDMYGTLRDPVNPPGTEDSAGGPGAPDTGEAERNPLP